MLPRNHVAIQVVVAKSLPSSSPPFTFMGRSMDRYIGWIVGAVRCGGVGRFFFSEIRPKTTTAEVLTTRVGYFKYGEFDFVC